MASPPSDTERNPRFLSAYYGAGARVYDQLVRSSAYTSGGKGTHFLGTGGVQEGGFGQRWTMRIPLIDLEGSLKRDLLVRQELQQQNETFIIRVPQNPDISDLVTAGATLTTVSTARVGDSTITVRTPSTETLTVYPRWFFRFFRADHPKIYNFSVDQPVEVGPIPNHQTIRIYPDLVEDVRIGTTIDMWPFMRCLWNRIFDVDELVLERRNEHQITIDVTEASLDG